MTCLNPLVGIATIIYAFGYTTKTSHWIGGSGILNFFIDRLFLKGYYTNIFEKPSFFESATPSIVVVLFST